MHNIKIRDNNKCNFCHGIDTISHLFISCPNNKILWKSWFTWWNRLSKTDISKYDNAEECILLGLGGKEDFIHALNFSILIAKQYIYYQLLTNENKIDFLSYLPILKNKLQIEKLLCEKENNHYKFNKFKFIFEDLYNTYIDVYFHLYNVVVICVNCLSLRWSPMCSTHVMSSVYMSLLYFIFHFSKSNIFVYIS